MVMVPSGACRSVLLAWLLAATGGLACGHGKAGAKATPREFVLGYDDARPNRSMAFPSDTYESLTLFRVPPGPHQALRVRLQAQAPGVIMIAVYKNSALETPDEPAILAVTREIAPEDVSDGKDGKWVVEDLHALPPLEGDTWVGVRKVAGSPELWTSGVVSGQVYIRDNDPKQTLGLLPVKRTPMVRLELAP
jgi:hypothetical protein